MKTVYILWFLFYIIPVTVNAQNISINATVDKTTVALNEQITLTITVNGDVSNLPQPNLPQLTGFNAYSAGSSHNISIINGKVTSSISFNYILVPKSVGKHTIEPITLNYKNQTYKTDPITIEVVQASQQQQQPSIQNQKRTVTVPKDISGKKIFITLDTDKKTAYVGEQITLSFKFYRNINLLGQPQYVPPSLTGFFSEDLPPQQEYYVNINGVRYLVTELKTALFPTAPGKYTIGSAQLQCNISEFSPDDFFNDDFFGNFFSMGKTKVLKTNPFEITVLPLPESDKPINFSGAVGSYKITTKLDKMDIKTNEPLTLNVIISGVGNLKTIPEPVIPEIKGFKKYQTLSSLNISKQNYKVQGSKVFKTIYIPQVSGKYTIPEIYFNYFDPETKTYITTKSNPITVSVAQGTKESAPGLTLATANDIKLIGTDIRHIKTDKLNINKNAKLIYKNSIFIILQFIPILSLLVTYGYKIKTEKLSKDIKYARFTRAYKTAKQKLKNLKKTITVISKLDSEEATKKIKKYYDELSNIFIEYIADKLNMLPAGLTVEILSEELTKKNVPGEQIKKVEALCREFDFARFAPGQITDKTHIENIYNETEQLINQLEKSL